MMLAIGSRRSFTSTFVVRLPMRGWRRRQFSSKARPTFGRPSFVGWRRQETERRRHLGRGVGLRRVALAPEECRLDATGAGALRRTDA